MNRRGFLGAMIAAAAGAAVDPEKLLWTPGAKLISVPAPVKLVTTGWADSVTFGVGDIVTIGGRYAINPITREATEYLQRFQVLREGRLQPIHDQPVGHLPRSVKSAWRRGYDAAGRRL